MDHVLLFLSAKLSFTGIGTVLNSLLPRRHWASPSTSLDKIYIIKLRPILHYRKFKVNDLSEFIFIRISLVGIREHYSYT